MFPLSGKDFPRNSEELAKAIRDALAQVLTFRGGSQPVTVAAANYPAIERIAVDLSGAEVSIDRPPPRPKPAGDRRPGITVRELQVVADPIRYQQSNATFHLTGSQMAFDFAHDQQGNAMLVLTDANDGHVDAEIGRAELRSLIMSAASTAARQQGASILDLQLNLQGQGPRSVIADVRVKARKMVSGTVVIKGRLDIDDDMNATLSGLSCTGEGMIGNLVAGMLQGQLKQLEGKRMALMAFSLGDVAVRDLQISTDDPIRVSAEFGRRSG